MDHVSVLLFLIVQNDGEYFLLIFLVGVGFLSANVVLAHLVRLVRSLLLLFFLRSRTISRLL